MTPSDYTPDPTKPWAAYVTEAIIYLKATSPAALQNQAHQAYLGDPLIGVDLTGGTTPGPLNWEDATEVQCAIYEWYGESGTDKSGIAPILAANVGPNVSWNYSYTQWGLPGALSGATT
jgi:hypothetical protein